FFTWLVTMLTLLAACSQGQPAAPSPGNTQTQAPSPTPASVSTPPATQATPAAKATPQITKDPVKLVFAGSVQATEQEFMRLHGGFIQKKYPNFTFERKASNQIPLAERAAIGDEM